jgi:hypothetical protein
MRAWEVLNTIIELRRAAADVVALADMAVYGQPGGQADAMNRLPDSIRRLQARATRALDALAEGGSR